MKREVQYHLAAFGLFLAKVSNINIRKLTSAQSAVLDDWSLFTSPRPVFFRGLGGKLAFLLLSSSLSTGSNLPLSEGPAQRFVLRYTLHRACSEWKQWLKMRLIHAASMRYRHTTGCVCFKCVCFEADIQIAEMQAWRQCSQHLLKCMPFVSVYMFIYLFIFLISSL